jgi:hypothetical protein
MQNIKKTFIYLFIYLFPYTAERKTLNNLFSLLFVVQVLSACVGKSVQNILLDVDARHGRLYCVGLNVEMLQDVTRQAQLCVLDLCGAEF